ncbi:MAG: hypothetical protein LBB58_04125 [Cellulomonadaceae bacterium]|jgi:hypothetical protein|nr:hypothetical protein [Cellulomonadaceae bacterium]
MEAKDFETYEDMIAWERELEGRIAKQVGELPDYLAEDVFISEHAGEWALAALQILRYAFAKEIPVDADLVKPAIDFWGNMFFSNFNSLLFAGRWLSSKQIEEVFEVGLMPGRGQLSNPSESLADYSIFPSP